MKNSDACFSCNQCENNFITQVDLKEHLKVHEVTSKTEGINCNKCEKTYGTMSKLRRHDWRSHREVECNVCGEILENRQRISLHRKTKHQIFTIAKCKFFPECIDEDECFFKHEEEKTPNQSTKSRSFCRNGSSCSDQSCTVSEQNHMKSRNILCRFQANCNRMKCSFKHTCDRKSFLEEGSTSPGEK